MRGGGGIRPPGKIGLIYNRPFLRVMRTRLYYKHVPLDSSALPSRQKREKFIWEYIHVMSKFE